MAKGQGFENKIGRMEILRANLREGRRVLGLTQAEMAERVGMSLEGYGSFERGNTNLTGKRLQEAFRLEDEFRKRGVLVTPAVEDIYKADTVCPACARKVPGPLQGAVFCFACGTRLGRMCPNGHVVPDGARYCPECGARMDVES